MSIVNGKEFAVGVRWAQMFYLCPPFFFFSFELNLAANDTPLEIVQHYQPPAASGANAYLKDSTLKVSESKALTLYPGD